MLEKEKEKERKRRRESLGERKIIRKKIVY
jgi:hypothetical protein